MAVALIRTVKGILKTAETLPRIIGIDVDAAATQLYFRYQAKYPSWGIWQNWAVPFEWNMNPMIGKHRLNYIGSSVVQPISFGFGISNAILDMLVSLNTVTDVPTWILTIYDGNHGGYGNGQTPEIQATLPLSGKTTPCGTYTEQFNTSAIVRGPYIIQKEVP